METVLKPKITAATITPRYVPQKRKTKTRATFTFQHKRRVKEIDIEGRRWIYHIFSTVVEVLVFLLILTVITLGAWGVFMLHVMA